MTVQLTKTFLNSLLKWKGEDKAFTDPEGIMVRVHEQKNRGQASVLFYTRIRNDGQNVKVKIGQWPQTSLANVRKEFYRIKECVARGLPWEIEPAKPSVSFGQAWEEWREYKDFGLSNNTIKKYDSLRSAHLERHFGIPVTKLDAKYVKVNILDPIVKEGRLAHCEYVAITLKRFMDYCVFIGYCVRNPLVGIRNILPAIPRGHYASFELDTLEDDMIKLFAAFKDEGREINVLLHMFFYTLLRSAELRYMQWEDVADDFKSAIVQTKCHPDFKVPFCTHAEHIMTELYRRKPLGQECVILTRAGQPYCGMALNMQFKRKGIPLTTHGIRACGRQWLQQEPTTKESIAELCLAHVVGNKTIQAYNRGTYFEQRQVAMQKWGDFVHHCIKEADAEISF